MDLSPEECSCPIGYECRHLAAVFLYLEKRAAKYSSVINSSQPILDWETEDWLKRIQTAAAKSQVPASKSSTAYNKILAFCIEKNAYRDEVTMNLRVGTVKKSGDVTLERALASADVSRPPKYLIRRGHSAGDTLPHSPTPPLRLPRPEARRESMRPVHRRCSGHRQIVHREEH